MRIKKLLQNDDAVSPVIGVILMVAITVILAAVIASFVLGLGDSTGETQPNVSLSFDYGEGEAGSGQDALNITITDGDSIDVGDLTVRGELDAGQFSSDLESIGGSGGVDSVEPLGGLSGVAAGNEIGAAQGVALLDAGSDSSGAWSAYDINIVWTGGEEDVTLESSTGPDA